MPKANNAVDDAPTRRSVLIAGAGIGLTATACTREARPPVGAPGPGAHAARRRQAGVTTPQQATALILAYDLDPALRGAVGVRQLKAVFARWTHALAEAQETADTQGTGETVDTQGTGETVDTQGTGEAGEADGGRTARLTATLGVGPGLPDRLGLRAPDALRDLPSFPGDRLDPARCGGDVLVQLCADSADATEATAVTLTRLAGDALSPRWRQGGFLPPSPDGGGTPRDLLGFRNGSANPTAEECERWVWSGDATYLVVRRVHLRVEDFARLAVHRQEEIVGRRRATGAPLDGGSEHDDVDPLAKDAQGRYATPPRSHVRAVSPRLDDGARMLRRSYSYADGPTDQGLLFLAFMRDPALFARVQRRMAAQDDLAAFTQARGSAVAYVLPGAGPGRPLGAELLG
ncbi:Dyp-type peroxidase [Streptomyces sp. ID05-04B]|uniref:Dyp-type peroxidase n=1 Tax=unclassified Streptomyces TaxID=2593676 RepID=UPI000D1A35D3|nr:MULTISPECIES: Dyp-type peroxidase [unclassified Streptomyces]AVV42659.1 Tat-translocated enzyme [Streptomyces sp. P3]MDX5562960.1 Dyp-type peroxidase [Streptomyces sp. ID05-04B]